MKRPPLLLNNLVNLFTGNNPCANPRPRIHEGSAGKDLGNFCLFKSQDGAKVSWPWKCVPRPLEFLQHYNSGVKMNQAFKPYPIFYPLTDKSRIRPNTHKSRVFLMGLALGLLLCPQDLIAHTGEILKDEIDKVEKLFTGGYMRLGLLGVCGFAAIYGIIKQSGWMFASGILGCVFAYFMKDWVLKTFTMVI